LIPWKDSHNELYRNTTNFRRELNFPTTLYVSLKFQHVYVCSIVYCPHFILNLFFFSFWFNFSIKWWVRFGRRKIIDFSSIFVPIFLFSLGLNFELQTKTGGEAREFNISYAKLGKKMGIHRSLEKLEKWSIISLMMHFYVSPTCTCALLCNVHNFCLFLCDFLFFVFAKNILLSGSRWSPVHVGEEK